MRNKVSSGAKKEVARIVSGMQSLGAEVFDGKNKLVHAVFDTARNNKITAAVQSDAARASKPKEFNV